MLVRGARTAAPRGSRNGNYRRGDWTREAIKERSGTPPPPRAPPRTARDGCAPRCRPGSRARDSRTPCSSFYFTLGLLRSKRVRNPFRIRRMAIAVKTRSHSVRRPRRLTTSRLLFRSESAYHTRKFGVSPVHHAAPRRRGRSRCAGRSTVPDLRTLFINVQHPGELPLEHPPRNDPKNPKAASSEAAAMNADSIQYALETDWPVGAAGFEPLHLEIRSAELHPASTGFRRRSGAPLVRASQTRQIYDVGIEPSNPSRRK